MESNSAHAQCSMHNRQYTLNGVQASVGIEHGRIVSECRNCNQCMQHPFNRYFSFAVESILRGGIYTTRVRDLFGCVRFHQSLLKLTWIASTLFINFLRNSMGKILLRQPSRCEQNGKILRQLHKRNRIHIFNYLWNGIAGVTPANHARPT